MPRFRNEEPEQSHYVDGDVVWVKIHNTEIWWPGEVTSSQDFRFVNASRPPFAVVAFFNEKTFEQVKSAKLIYPFQCAHKEEFIRLGTSKYKKSEGHNMGDKFNEDVAIAEARFLGTPHQLSSLHAASASASRPDSLIKALLSSSTSSSQRNSSTRSSSGVPSPAANRQPEPTFRIMDIGSTNESSRERRVDDSYDCHMCNFRTTSMDVLLIHRRGHMESSSSYSSTNSTTNSSSSISKRATRRANTTNAFDLRQLSQRRSGDSTHFLPNSVRCHSRHVSIVVDASLTDEEQQRVASIAQQTMKSIERVVHPSSASSSASTNSHSRRRSVRNSCSSSQQPPPAVPVPVAVLSAVETTHRSTQNPRDPRSQRSNQLRATMPAPQPPPPPPAAKQRRLTRSMSRLQQGTSTLELPPPLAQTTPKRSAGRRRTLAVTAAPNESPAIVPRRSNPMRKTLTAVPETALATGRRKRTLPKNMEPKTPTTISPRQSPSPTPPPPPPPAESTPATAAKQLPDAEDVIAEEPPAPKKPRPEEEATPPATVIHPQQQQPNNIAGSLELQRSLMAEWCDDEMDELPEEEEEETAAEPMEHSTPNGRKAAALEEGEQEPKRLPEDDDDDDEPKLAERMPAKKRIRNIPKKDRRDVVRQEFDVEPDEPIVIPDSDASSNESVVFVDDEPRQRRKRHAAGGHNSSKSTSTSTSSSTPKAANNSSCFDFEEEEEDDLRQQQHTEGQNGLSYRRGTQTNRLDINGKSHSTAEVESPPEAGTEAEAEAATEAGEKEETPAEPVAPAQDDLFMGFDEVQQSLAEAEIQPQEPVEAEQAEPEIEVIAEAQKELEEAEAEAEAELEVEPGDHLSLPIKERQKRIFKSRNKSTVAAPKEEDLAVQEEVQPEQQEQPPTNGNGAAADQLDLCNGEENNSMAESRRRDKTKTESSKRRLKAKATRQKNRSPTPVPVPEELSNNSSSTSTSNSSSSSSNSGSSSNSSSNSSNSSSSNNSHSNHLCRPGSSPGLLSPVLSSSNSCSIASNIAVISPEEARELQRSASGAGLIHAAIVDATQPVQRGGVLILEDIRLPNLYKPFGSLSSSSVSNDSRRPVEHHEGAGKEDDDDNDDERSQDSRASEQPAAVEEKLDGVSQVVDDYDAEESLLNDSKISEEVAHSPLLPHSPAEVLHFVSQPREVLLKKREQELLRQYKADLVSGRSAEKCRKARERWGRTMRSTEEKEPTEQPTEQVEAEVATEATRPEEDQYDLGQSKENMEEEELQQQADESKDSLDAELAAIELVLPTNLYNRGSRRALSHPHANLAVVSGRKASGHLGYAQTLCDADVAKAHQQLVDLREQQRRRDPTAAAAATTTTPPEPRRQRRRSRNPASNDLVECTFRFDVADEASCETKEVQESLTPQLCAGRICAVMTRPIPGYNHTFMLCSLANNNFTPLNNVALYLDSEKNHLVPVPREALLEPPRLADGHPLSAVFADIDILGDEAVAQAMEPVETETESQPDLLQSQSQSQVEVERMSTVQILLSDSENGEGGGGGHEEEPVETLGIMTPLSQVAEGSALAASSSYVNEDDGQLSLHDDQVDSNVLQLNVNGHRLELDPSMLFSIAEQPDSCIELSVAETSPTTGGVCGVGSTTTAVLHARDILQAAQVYLQERDLQLVNVEDMTLDGEEAMAVPVTDLLSQALAGSQVVDDDDFVDAANAGVGSLLHIDTRTAGGGGGGGGDSVEPGVSVVYISHALAPPAAHLTPPITARTNETNALLDQTPIMSTLENPSGGLQLRRVSPLAEGNLEDSLAVIGVTNGSGVPTSLELPITVTNPAIAPRVTAPTPIVDMVQFAPFQ
ncbi:serine-rich adhesin for platelets isoform X1 [Drosophila kikkawai]|uniref:Serine-rich adhesin for platelets isoform X1 n=1 Tax=Drosophila kikkawai TaxID=30033 RepID=A0A6P4J0K2_DROKI|nr:uncharacterized protein LOC108079211 isoform X1 [Drosophila kikkawai]